MIKILDHNPRNKNYGQLFFVTYICTTNFFLKYDIHDQNFRLFRCTKYQISWLKL